MKKIPLILLCFVVITTSFAQTGFPNNGSASNASTLFNYLGGLTSNGYKIKRFTDTTEANLQPFLKYTPNLMIKAGETVYQRNNDATGWLEMGGGGSGGGDIITDSTITTIPTVGTFVHPNLSSKDWINAVFHGSQSPLSTISGGGIFEYTTGTTVSKNLNWTASRQPKTTNLTSIVIGGISLAFVNPSAPGTVSGTQTVSVPVNTNTTYSNVVTASNGMNATSSTTFTYQRKIFAGFVSTATPSDADIIAATNSSYVGGVFSNTRVQSGALSTPSTSSYVMFASPASFGVPTVVINGLTVTFNQITRSFVNINSYSSSYYIMVSPFPTSGGVAVYSIQ